MKKLFRLPSLAFQLCASRLKRSLISPLFSPPSTRPGIGSLEFAILEDHKLAFCFTKENVA
jgi:hypothetical protein